LCLLRIILVKEAVFNLRTGGNGMHQFHLHGAQLVEDCLNFGGFHAAFKVVQEGVIDMVVGGKVRGILAAEFDHALEVGQESSKVIFGAGAGPGFLRDRGNLCKLGNFGGGHPGGFVVITAAVFDQASLNRIWIEAGRFGFGGNNQVVGFVIDEAFV